MAAHRHTKGKITAKVRGRGANLVLNWGRFLCLSVIFVVSKCVFFATCRQIGFKCFRGTFFRTPGSANIGKCSPKRCRVVQKQGLRKSQHIATWRHPGGRKVTPFITFQGQFGYQFQKKDTKKAYLKTSIFWTVAKCCAGGYAHFRTITRCQATPVQ